MKRTQLEIAEYNLWKAMDRELCKMVRDSNVPASVVSLIRSTGISKPTAERFRDGSLLSLTYLELIVRKLNLNCKEELRNYKYVVGYKHDSKQCSKCRKIKAAEDFYIDKSTKTGLTAYCKPCQRAYSKKKYMEKNDFLSLSVS